MTMQQTKLLYAFVRTIREGKLVDADFIDRAHDVIGRELKRMRVAAGEPANHDTYAHDERMH